MRQIFATADNPDSNRERSTSRQTGYQINHPCIVKSRYCQESVLPPVEPHTGNSTRDACNTKSTTNCESLFPAPNRHTGADRAGFQVPGKFALSPSLLHRPDDGSIYHRIGAIGNPAQQPRSILRTGYQLPGCKTSIAHWRYQTLTGSNTILDHWFRSIALSTFSMT